MTTSGRDKCNNRSCVSECSECICIILKVLFAQCEEVVVYTGIYKVRNMDEVGVVDVSHKQWTLAQETGVPSIPCETKS